MSRWIIILLVVVGGKNYLERIFALIMAKLDDKILFRLNRGLKEVLKRRCRKMGVSVGDYIRKLILDSFKNKSI